MAAAGGSFRSRLRQTGAGPPLSTSTAPAALASPTGASGAARSYSAGAAAPPGAAARGRSGAESREPGGVRHTALCLPARVSAFRVSVGAKRPFPHYQSRRIPCRWAFSGCAGAAEGCAHHFVRALPAAARERCPACHSVKAAFLPPWERAPPGRADCGRVHAPPAWFHAPPPARAHARHRGASPARGERSAEEPARLSRDGFRGWAPCCRKKCFESQGSQGVEEIGGGRYCSR